MTKSQIIQKAGLYLDDTSELSSQELSDLFDKIYRKVCSDRPWEFTKKEGTGVTSSSVPYVALHPDFAFLTANANHTESEYEAQGPVIYVGTTFDPYRVVSWSDRRSYRNQTGVCYIDIANLRLYFTKQPDGGTPVEYDYHCFMPALNNNQSPAFPEAFHDAIYHGMVVDEFVIQQSDKAKSYAGENQRMYEDFLSRMAYWNANLIQQ